MKKTGTQLPRKWTVPLQNVCNNSSRCLSMRPFLNESTCTPTVSLESQTVISILNLAFLAISNTPYFLRSLSLQSLCKTTQSRTLFRKKKTPWSPAAQKPRSRCLQARNVTEMTIYLSETCVRRSKRNRSKQLNTCLRENESIWRRWWVSFLSFRWRK